MMTISPSQQQQAIPQFTVFYYELVIFELTATYGNGTDISFERIADTFKIAAEISEKFPDLLYPCANLIRTSGIDGLQVRKYLQTHKPTLLCLPSSNSIESPSHPPSAIGIDSMTDCCGYKVTKTGVCLPSWTAADERMFLVQYTKVAPHHYKDDLAIFVYELLTRWNIQGSGGEVTTIRDGLQGLKKFTDIDAKKRAIFDQHERERSQRLERQKKKAEDNERLEQERRQLETNFERLKVAERARAEKEELDRSRQEQELARDREQQALLDLARKKRDLNRVREEETELERANEAELERLREETELSTALEEKLNVRTRDDMIEDRMQELLNTTKATDARKQQVMDLMDRLTSGLRTHFKENGIEVLLFGSFATGLCDQSSDADFSVIDRANSIKTISRLATALRKLGYSNIVPISSARVPIATFEDPVNSIRCDICLNQTHGVHNSMLIDTYRRIDNRFLPLWFAIRHLARKHNILSGRERYLTSYALVMMMITFLQAQTKPVLPKLQKQATTTPGPVIDGSDYSFDNDWSKYTSFGSTNNRTSALLLKEFCLCFGGTLVNFKTYEINPRLGIIRKTRQVDFATSEFERSKLRNAPICIMDPFILDRNLAQNILPAHVTHIKKVFMDARAILAEGDIDKFFS